MFRHNRKQGPQGAVEMPDQLTSDAEGMYWLALVLTDDEELAASLTRESIKQLVTGNLAFVPWIGRRSHRIIIKACIAAKNAELAADQRHSESWDAAAAEIEIGNVQPLRELPLDSIQRSERSLPLLPRFLFVMNVLEGYSLNDAAQLLRTPRSTCESALRYAFAALTDAIHVRCEERLAERTRIAQELHDTFLQGVLSVCMQLHVTVDQLPEDATIRPALSRILQLAGQVVDEARNMLRGLRSSSQSAHDLKTLLSHIPEELGSRGVDFRVVVEGASLPLRSVIRDDVYSIGREALVNALRHSGASNIDVHLQYGTDQLRVLVQDNGAGIDPQVVRFGRDGHWGLLGMKERAERIGAKLRVLSRSGGGTEVELCVPSEVAFEHNQPIPTSTWFRHYGADKKELEPSCWQLVESKHTPQQALPSIRTTI